ncbi:MAG TPA: permease prefix domain 1-containing protein [Actinomycetales bacterium]|nr:permease prefix domain 1-containing protein [Actinomycetales bacterium]
MAALEAQISEWRHYVGRSRGVQGPDVEELEAHLREQIDALGGAGLADDEAFLVAVKRMGAIDALSREFAREHSGRLWKQLVLTADAEPERPSRGLTSALVVAVLAALAVHVPRLFGLGAPTGEEGTFYLRNAGLLVLPFLAGWFTLRRGLTRRQVLVTAVPFAVGAVVVNVYPWAPNSATELLVVLHLPVALWFAVAYASMGGAWRSHERRMDVVRFTGEWFIYYTLIALGGGVLLGLTALILEPVSPGLVEPLFVWVLPSGAAGAVLVAAWLVEAKQDVVENMAPVLTAVFTPLFAVVLAGSAATYMVSGFAGEFHRDVLGVFDVLLVVVLGLVLYSTSARDPARPAGVLDRLQLVAVASALVLDAVVLAAMVTRIGDLGWTPNRVAALGLNLLLLVNLARAAHLSVRFLAGRVAFHRLERWQTTYLPTYGLWAAAVVAVLPPLFAFA